MITGSGAVDARQSFAHPPEGATMYSQADLRRAARGMARDESEGARVLDWVVVVTADGRTVMRVLAETRARASCPGGHVFWTAMDL